MSTSLGPVQCKNCACVLNESPSLPVDQRQPCQSCGSLNRHHNAELAERVEARASLGLKHKRPGFKKPIYEEVVKPDLHRKTNRWSFLVRIIDRYRNRYREHITDIESGRVVRSVDEPLTDHVNRGSAKK